MSVADCQIDNIQVVGTVALVGARYFNSMFGKGNRLHLRPLSLKHLLSVFSTVVASFSIFNCNTAAF